MSLKETVHRNDKPIASNYDTLTNILDDCEQFAFEFQEDKKEVKKEVSSLYDSSETSISSDGNHLPIGSVKVASPAGVDEKDAYLHWQESQQTLP